jgi:hypothetical protein
MKIARQLRRFLFGTFLAVIIEIVASLVTTLVIGLG